MVIVLKPKASSISGFYLSLNSCVLHCPSACVEYRTKARILYFGDSYRSRYLYGFVLRGCTFAACPLGPRLLQFIIPPLTVYLAELNERPRRGASPLFGKLEAVPFDRRRSDQTTISISRPLITAPSQVEYSN